jgi:uroporphyrinogen-III decarboxylase
MTPRERMNMAMRLQHPDRVPLMCQFSFGFINQQLKGSGISPMEMWLDASKYVEGMMILRDRFDFDGILVSVHGHFDDWRSQIKKLDRQHGIEIATFENRRESYPDDDLPSAEFFITRVHDIESVLIQEIPEEISYIPSSRDCHAFIDQQDPFRVFDILDEKVKEKYSIHSEVTSPFDYFLDLLGYENALLALLYDPDKCKQILQRYTDGLVRLTGDMCKQNIDAVKISSPFAGMGFISPDQYLEFEQPYIRQLTDVISRSGKFSYIHTCGLINDRLEFMRDTGTNGLECLDPPPIGNVELEDAFSRIGSKMFIKGNIDPVNTLFKGTEDSISQDVTKRLEIGMQHPGFILSTACSIAPKTPSDNVLLLRQLIEKYGFYA